MANKHDRRSTPIVTKKLQIKITVWSYTHTHQDAENEKIEKAKWRYQGFHTLLVDRRISTTALEICLEVSI